MPQTSSNQMIRAPIPFIYIPLPYIFALYAIIWSIWLMRNDMVFNDKIYDQRQILDSIKLRTANWFKAKWPECTDSVLDLIRRPNLIRRSPVVKAVKKGILWMAPPSDYLKFNVDGSSKGKPGPAGIGGVLRDNTTAVKLIFSKSIGVADSNVAELLAVREALSVYATSRWASSHRLIIECESSNVVKWVTNPICSPWSVRKVISHIEIFKAQLVGCKIVHILRSGNDIADALAKSGVTRQADLVVIYE